MSALINATGTNGKVELHSDLVRIDRRDVLGDWNLSHGQLSQVEIRLADLLRVDLRLATMFVDGCIYFVQAGVSEKSVNDLEIFENQNSVSFDRGQQDQFWRFKQEVDSRLGVDLAAQSDSVEEHAVGGSQSEFPQNFNVYAELTRHRDWKAICKLNRVEFDNFGTAKELNALPRFLEQDEVVFALTSGLIPQGETSNELDFGLNTWLVVLTNERFLFVDAAMLSTSIDIQSIRHERVQAISFSQGWAFGKIMIDLGSRLVTIDNCSRDSVVPFGTLGNKWYKTLQERSMSAVASRPDVSPTFSQVESLERLARLYSQGALSDEEYAHAKSRVLASM